MLRFLQLGGIEVLESLTLPFPDVHPGDIVIKVHAVE